MQSINTTSRIFNKLMNFDTKFIESFKDHYFVGIDEVGRGALAGPVIACAFCWKKEYAQKDLTKYKTLRKLNDSKKIKLKDRLRLYRTLIKVGDFSIGHASIKEIEVLNILNATFLAMKRAYESLILKLDQVKPSYVLVDGNKFNPFINSRQSSIVDGDAQSALIASASIIAKVYRDMLMRRIARGKRYKSFGWQRNVGYGTDFHMKAISKCGLTPLHRKLFVRKVIARYGMPLNVHCFQ